MKTYSIITGYGKVLNTVTEKEYSEIKRQVYSRTCLYIRQLRLFFAGIKSLTYFIHRSPIIFILIWGIAVILGSSSVNGFLLSFCSIIFLFSCLIFKHGVQIMFGVREVPYVFEEEIKKERLFAKQG